MRSLRLAAVAVLAILAAAPSAAGEGVVDVAPGTVVLWRGEGFDSCGMSGRKWAARADGCWFAIDLLHAEGGLELARWQAGKLESRQVRVSSYAYPEQRITLKDDSQVHLSAEDLERVRGEQARVAALWRRPDEGSVGLPLARPLAELPEGSRFGLRRFFNDEPRSPHSGADYPAAEGTPVRAAAGGEVALAADLFFSGSSVFLDHGDGLISMYFHLSRIEVAEGERVERGQTIGRVGQTGRATGPHLHFGLRWRGARVDPALLLGGTDSVQVLSAGR